jgi:hypothetical protein
MTTTADGRPGDSPLQVLHARLETHFAGLSEARQALQPDAPVFALEHGLSEAELLLLRTEIRAAVRRQRLDRRAWLPLVVYAAEIGYSYSGDEYWQTFEASAPGWAMLDKRHYLRERFKEFRRLFNGAEPTGPWAGHFTIICWPITHAVLPTDLQRQLARLLFEYRRSLTSDQLATPDELGRNLGARAWHGSSRFQIFAENTSLLGLVAASLLLGGGEQTSRLLDSTLARIVDDLTSERQARTWLNGAQNAAARVRARGLRPVPTELAVSPQARGRPRLAAAADPLVFLRREDHGWAAYLEMPDFSLLADRLPTIAHDLLRRRAIVAGAAGAPLAGGRLLHPGQIVKLASWPRPDKPLIQLEGGSDASNSILADQSVMTSGPTWLFRVRENGMAREVRGKFVRPGEDYILLTVSDRSSSPPSWIRESRSAIAGVTAVAVKVPDAVGPADLQSLQEIGAGIVTQIEVRPVGIVPAHWDGEGRAEWLVDENPTIAISSEQAVEHCIVTTDGVPGLFEWPTGSSELFLGFEDLPAGRHEVEVALLLAGRSETSAEGRIEMVMRPPHVRPPAGTMREGLMILATPVTPTMPEIWDETAYLELRGPIDARVALRFDLRDREGKAIATMTIGAALPVNATQWRQLVRGKIRKPFSVSYDRADRMTVVASHSTLGSVSLTAERPFEPLRWALRRRDGDAVLELIDNSGANDVAVTQRAFDRPDRPTPVGLLGGQLRLSEGGLVTAEAGDHRARVIAPRTTVRTFADMGLRPSLSGRTRTTESVADLVEVSHEWWAAPLPANIVAASWRQQILDDLARASTNLIVGHRWDILEQNRVQRNWAPLFDGIGKAPHHRTLASKIFTGALELSNTDLDGAVGLLAQAFEQHAPRLLRERSTELSTFVLRLATNPGSLPAHIDPQELRRRLQLVMETPVLLKAARLLIVVVESESASNSLEWTWP